MTQCSKKREIFRAADRRRRSKDQYPSSSLDHNIHIKVLIPDLQISLYSFIYSPSLSAQMPLLPEAASVPGPVHSFLRFQGYNLPHSGQASSW